jgi:hypothetical protein
MLEGTPADDQISVKPTGSPSLAVPDPDFKGSSESLASEFRCKWIKVFNSGIGKTKNFYKNQTEWIDCFLFESCASCKLMVLGLLNPLCTKPFY